MDSFLRSFLDACFASELSKTQEAIATGRLTADDLDKGLELAAHIAHSDIVATLFDAGARVTASTVASLPGRDLQQQPSVVRLFLDHGLDPNWRRASGEPLLPYVLLTLLASRISAAETNLWWPNSALLNPACARELLARGADPNLCGPRGIHSPPFGRAIVSTRQEPLSLLELYLAQGAVLDSHLLFYAVRSRVGQGELKTRFLLGKGLDPNVTNAEWGTPLHLAVHASKPNIVRLLLDAGADPSAISVGRKNYGESPAREAERLPHPGTREAILSLLGCRPGANGC